MEYIEQLTIAQLRHMKESEDHVEFKSARHNYPYNGGKHSDPRDRRHCVLGYVVALANEKGGLIVKDGDKLRLCDSYREMQIRSRGNKQKEKQRGNHGEAINEAINEAIKSVFLYIAENKDVTGPKIGEILAMPKSKVDRSLAFLRKPSVDLVYHVGSKRTGCYMLTDKGTELYERIQAISGYDR